MIKKIKVNPKLIGEKVLNDIVFTDTFFYNQIFLGTEITVFASFEVKVPHPDTKPIFLSLKRILKRDIFKEDPEKDFENTLNNINNEFKKIFSFAETQNIPKTWFKSFSSTIGIIYNNNLLISTTGGTTAYLARGNELDEISSNSEKTEIPCFPVINIGEIENDDKIIILSSDLNLSINKERLKISASNKDLTKVLEFLDNATNENDGINTAILLECKETKIFNSENIKSEILTSQKSNDENFKNYKEQTSTSDKNKILNFAKFLFSNFQDKFPIFLSNTKNFLQNFFSSLFNKEMLKDLKANLEKPTSSGIVSIDQTKNKRGFKFSGPIDFKKLFQFNWLTLNGKIFFSTILAISIFFSFKSCSNNNTSQNTETTLQEQKNSLARARELVSVAQTIFIAKPSDYQTKIEFNLVEAEKQLKKVTESEFKTEKDTTLTTIQKIREKIQGIERAGQSSLIADFATMDDTIRSFQFIEPDEIYAFGSKGVYNFRIPSSVENLPVTITKLSTDITSIGNILFSATSDSNQVMILYSDLNGSKIVSTFNFSNDKKIIKSELPNSLTWPSAISIDTWDLSTNTLLYLLSTQQNKIFKYTPTQTGFGTPVNYFKSDVDLSTATSFAIDGNVYVMHSTGILDIYTAGNLIKSNDLKTIAGLSAPTKIFKTLAKNSSEQDFLFVLDQERKFLSILSIEPDNSVTLKKNLDISNLISNGSISEFFPTKSSGSYNKVFFLIDNKLYFLELNL